MFKRFGSRNILPSLAGASVSQRRALNVHEYSAKQLLKEQGASVEFGVMCESIEAVKAACAQIKTDKKVVKSQILAGGRGKGTFVDGYQGGVKVTASTEEAVEVAGKMLNNTLVTKQTGPNGIKVTKLFVTEAVKGIAKELYVALVLDRATYKPTFIVSTEGGMAIEEVAAEKPECIKKMHVDLNKGFDKTAAQKLATDLGLSEKTAQSLSTQMEAIYRLAKTKDATMVEINPLVVLEDETTMCIDAKLNFDDNAQFRRKDIWKHEDIHQKDPKEIAAAKWDLQYIALDGEVGCMVNGAGLAMSTMDIISLYGAKPANFLDAGGSAQEDQIVAAFEIIASDKNVKVLLVNIFGGIVRCDMIANGIVAAVKKLSAKGTFNLPLVVRLSGTNEEAGKKILAESGLTITSCANLDEAGKVAAQLAKQA